MPAARPSTPSIRLKALVTPTSQVAVTGHAIQPSVHVNPSSDTRSMSRPDDITIAAAVSSISSFGTAPNPRTSSISPARKISPPAIKKGRIACHGSGSMEPGRSSGTSPIARPAARTTARPPRRGTEWA